jgi:16S rRNA (cytidine1402-2'-O)-methyltransferase
MPGVLYLLPTQLGNTPWAAVLPTGSQQIACSLRHFIVENAKTTRAALKWLNHPISVREIAIEQLPDPLTPPEIDRLLNPLHANQNIGLMSEAGCPGVADPGTLLVRRAHETGITVRPLVGPSSILLALMASGLDGQRFAFHGYLPAHEPERGKRIVELEKESAHKQQTQLFIETPYRNDALLDALLATCRTETLLCLACDLTLASEFIETRRIKTWRQLPHPDLNRRPTVFLFLSAR